MSILAFETHLGKLPLGVNKMCEWEGEGHLLPFYINIPGISYKTLYETGHYTQWSSLF